MIRIVARVDPKRRNPCRSEGFFLVFVTHNARNFGRVLCRLRLSQREKRSTAHVATVLTVSKNVG